MIKTHHKSHSNMLFAQVHGMFTQEKFDQVFIDQADKIIAEFQFIHIILELDNKLSGWQLLNVFQRFKQYITPYKNMSKLAVVCDNKILGWRFFILQTQPVMTMEYFTYKDIEKAKAWLTIG